jgi:hypothetical protein
LKKISFQQEAVSIPPSCMHVLEEENQNQMPYSSVVDW